MVWLVLAILAALVGIGFLLKGKSRNEFRESTDLRWVGVALLLVGGALIMFGSVYRLGVGEAAVLRSVSGKVQPSPVTEAGFHFKAPWYDAEKWNTRNLVMNFNQNTGTEDSDTVANDGAISTSTRDGASLDFDVTISYALQPGGVVELSRQYRTQEGFTNQVLLPGARSAARNGSTTFNAVTIRNERIQLGAQITTDLSNRLSNFGVEVGAADVREIRLPPEIVNNLNDIQTRQAEVEKARAELDKAKIEGETTKTRAKADSDADQIIRCGATITSEEQVIAGKKQEVQVVRPVSNDKCENRLNESVLTARYIEMLRLAAEKGSTIYVLPQDGNQLLQLQPNK